MNDFYDELTPFYHLVHQDRDASIRHQGEQLTALIDAEWPGRNTILDVGTQAIALAQQGRPVRSRYYAISTDRLCALMREAGFNHVRRIDGAFYQSVLVGTKGPAD